MVGEEEKPQNTDVITLGCFVFFQLWKSHIHYMNQGNEG